MLFLLDSNAFSDLMRKNPRVEAQLAALGPNDKVVICQSFGVRSFTRGEILYGVRGAVQSGSVLIVACYPALAFPWRTPGTHPRRAPSGPAAQLEMTARTGERRSMSELRATR